MKSGSWAFAISCAILLLNVIYNASVPLHPDEAYYWVYSRNLDLSYFDHPPMIAYMIRLFTVFGSTEFAIRLVNVFCVTVSAYAAYLISKEIFGEKVARFSLLIYLIAPCTNVAYLVTTPDSPLILFWSLASLFVYRYVFRGNGYYMYLGGVAAGLALLSKYTAILIFPSVFLFLLSSKRGRALLRSPHVYLSFLLSMLLFTPVILWNYWHDWVSFAFQIHHGASVSKIFDVKSLGDFVGGQMLLVTPFLFVPLIVYISRRRYWNEVFGNEKVRYLVFLFAVPVLFFMYNSLHTKSEPNWTAPAYITGIILVSNYVYAYQRELLFALFALFSIALLFVAKFPEPFPGLSPHLVVKRALYGNDTIFEPVGEMLKAHPEWTLYSDCYQNASLVWFYLRPDEVRVVTKSRFSNYDLWERAYAGKPGDGILVTNEYDAGNDIHRMFRRVTLIRNLEFENAFVKKEYQVYLCKND